MHEENAQQWQWQWQCAANECAPGSVRRALRPFHRAACVETDLEPCYYSSSALQGLVLVLVRACQCVVRAVLPLLR